MQGTTTIIEVLMKDGQYFQPLVIKCQSWAPSFPQVSSIMLVSKAGWLLVADFLIQTTFNPAIICSSPGTLTVFSGVLIFILLCSCLPPQYYVLALWPLRSTPGCPTYEKSPSNHVLEVDFPSIWTHLESKLIPFPRLLLNIRGIGVESTTHSIALERVMDRRAAARAVEQRFQSNPRTFAWTKRREIVAYLWTRFEKASQTRNSQDPVKCMYGVSRTNVILSRWGSIEVVNVRTMTWMQELLGHCCLVSLLGLELQDC